MSLLFRQSVVAACLALFCAGLHAQDVRTNVVVDSNPAVFAVLAGLNAAGYRDGLSPNETIRRSVLQQMLAHPSPALQALKAYYATHHSANAGQDLARYVVLGMFVGNPPGLSLTLPPSGLPPSAESVSDVLPLLRDFWQQGNLDAVWQSVQPQYTAALNADSTRLRAMVTQVNSFFRVSPAYSPRQFFIFPDAMIGPGETDALNYEDNYYLVTNLRLQDDMHQVRHTYLQFLLDPLVAQYPAALDPVKQEILPLVQRAPALNPQFKHNASLLFTDCLVRAVEIELDPGTIAQKSARVQAAMRQGLVLTGLWYAQLEKYRSDPAGFEQFYPQAAFALRIANLAGTVKHMQFSPAPAPAAAALAAAAQPVRAPSPMEVAQRRFDAHDLTTAAKLAQAVLRQPRGDYASAYYLLGKIAALHNQPQAAMKNFQSVLAQAQPGQHHLRAWANMYMARLYDAERNRPQAVAHYKAALASADTPATQALAKAGIKAPFLPPGGKH
ncbi:MAG: hypothetical protein ACRD04_00135 [Terriglobales bacterium]